MTLALLAGVSPVQAAPHADLAAAGELAPTEAPAPLRCLTLHYPVRALQEGGAWWLLLPDGARVPYDDGRVKDFETKLAQPDVEDAFSQPYPRGPIVPVTTPDQDPGRIRVEPLFAAVYGKERAAVQVESLPFLGRTLQINRRAAPAFARVERRLAALLVSQPGLRAFLQDLGGTFVWRKIAGTDRQSAHSYGVSLDINVKRSHYWRWQGGGPPRWQNSIPQPIVDAFEAEGFIWGGRWYHYDTMHFEYRPELLDPRCGSSPQRATGNRGADAALAIPGEPPRPPRPSRAAETAR